MAYLDQTTPEFPITTWQVTTNDLQVDVTADFGAGLQTFSQIFPAGDYWGYESQLAGPPWLQQPTSLIGQLGSIIQSILQDPGGFNQAGALVETQMLWGTSGATTWLQGQFFVSGLVGLSSSIAVTLPLGSDATLFGVDPITGILTLANLTPTTAAGTNVFNSAGYWAPYNLTVLDDRKFTREISQTLGLYSGTVDTLQWGEERLERLLTFPFVYVAYIYAYRRQLQVFSDVASTAISDPNNLLENLIEAAALNLQMRIWQDNGQYRSGYVLSEVLSDTDASLSDVSGRGALWSVSIPFIDINVNGGNPI